MSESYYQTPQKTEITKLEDQINFLNFSYNQLQTANERNKFLEQEIETIKNTFHEVKLELTREYLKNTFLYHELENLKKSYSEKIVEVFAEKEEFKDKYNDKVKECNKLREKLNLNQSMLNKSISESQFISTESLKTVEEIKKQKDAIEIKYELLLWKTETKTEIEEKLFEFLYRNGLLKYAKSIIENEIDYDLLSDMSEKDFKEIGFDDKSIATIFSKLHKDPGSC